MSVDLGINTKGLSDKQVQALEQSIAGAIEVNTNARKAELVQARASSAFPIQRRGQRLPGDVGKNFGLLGNDIHGPLGFLGPFDQSYPGSYFFSGSFGGGGFGLNQDGQGGLGGFSGYGQGSHTSFKRNTRLAHHKMALCVSAYKGFGLAKNAIDLMANFAAEGLKIRHPNKTVERFLNRWAFHVNLQGRVKDIIRYYYKYGNVFIYRTMGEIDENAYVKMKRSKAKTDEEGLPGFRPYLDDNMLNILKSLGIDIDPVDDPQQSERFDEAEEEGKKPVGKRQIPWQYLLLNPFQMELRGTKFFGGQRWVFVLDYNTINEIRSNRLKSRHAFIDFLDESDINLPPEFKKASDVITTDAPDNENNDPRIVDIEQTKLYTMHYMKDDHEDWADPLLWPVMGDILYKSKLRQMDMSVCNSVINAVTIYKLGNLSEGFIPPKSHFSEFAEFLRTPTAAMNLVWNDALSIESSYPPVDKILGIGKYESVDRDILRGVGIPDTLIGGQVKSSFSTGFLGVRTLLERLEEARHTVVRWIMKELELLVKTLKIKKMPTIRFGKMSLRDEKSEKQLIIQLLDRNIISVEAVLEAFGEEFEIELERLKDEEKLRESTGLFQKHSPYVDPISDLDIEEQMKQEAEFKRQEQRLMIKMKDKENRAKRNAGGPNGRPDNTDGIPQENKRETKPQGMAWLRDYEIAKACTFKHVESVEKLVSHRILKALGKKTRRSLTKHEAKGVEEITFAIASQTPITEKITFKVMEKILSENPSIDGDVYRVYTDMKQDNMTLTDRKVAMAGAIAYCTLQGD